MSSARASADPLDRLLQSIGSGATSPVYLVAGDRVLAEPAAQRIADALARHPAAEVTRLRRPPGLARVLADLRTFSLFGSGKVALVVDTAVLADRASAAMLIDEIAEILPVGEGETLLEKEVEAAGRLLLVLRCFDLEPKTPAAPASDTVEQLPSWVLEGGAGGGRRGSRRRGKRQVEKLRADLVVLLEKALEAGLRGWAEGDLAELERAIDEGLPSEHHLVMAESGVASDHPLVARLRQAGALVELGGVELDRRGQLTGLELLAAELERETGVSITADAVQELGRRTVRKDSGWGAEAGIDPDSTARFAAEYRKLAGVAGDRTIDLDLVRDSVEDRGQEDVWRLLDEVGGGDVGASLLRLRRLLGSAGETSAARLSVFTMLADLCRQMLVMDALLASTGAQRGERNYRRFQERVVKRLQGPLPGGAANPIAGLHPYRLHRVYLAASRLRQAHLERLPWRVLETETRLKGESGDADAALAELVAAISAGRVDPMTRRRAAVR